MTSFSRVHSWGQAHIASIAVENSDLISTQLYFGSIVLFNSLRAMNPSEANLCSFNNELARDFPTSETTQLVGLIREQLIRYVDEFYGFKVEDSDVTLLHGFVCANFPGARQPLLEPHDHRRSDVVVTYYAQIRQDEGLVRFWNPLVPRGRNEGENLVFTPRTGEMVFVPGTVPHDILPFEPTEPFVSVETHFSIKGFPRESQG